MIVVVVVVVCLERREAVRGGCRRAQTRVGGRGWQGNLTHSRAKDQPAENDKYKHCTGCNNREHQRCPPKLKLNHRGFRRRELGR